MRSSNASAKTIGEKIDLQSQELRDCPAIISSDYRPLSYGELQSLIGQIRADLRSAGFGPRARIAVAVPSGVHAALSLVAVMASAVAVPLNSNSTAHEVEVFADTLQPDAILMLAGSNIAARRVAERKGICIIEAIPAKDRRPGLKILVPRADNEAAPETPEPEAPAFILHTSGTTSEPKLIPFSHQNMLAAAERVSGWFNLTPQDRCLCVTPIYYSHGLKVTVLTPLLTGGSIAFPADPAAFDYAEWFGALNPTWYSAGPTLHTFIFDHVKSVIDAETKHSLRFILSGGAPLPREIQNGLQRTLGIPVVEHYGSSEAAQISANLPPPGASKPGSCGIPPPGTVMIVDENGRPVPPGIEGEILVGGPTLMAGYLNAPELNRASFVGGWLKTGDIGSFDDEGFLTLHGRQKDLISRGAEKIWPVEIESVLMQHPAVAEAAAFGVPHPRLGEDVFAAVVLRHGMTAHEPELRTFLSQQLSAFKVPRQIKVVGELPKGLSGKLLRRKLREAFVPNTMPNLDLITLPDENPLTLKLTDIWKRLLNTASVGLDDDFFESGGDSLLATELLSEIEKLAGQVVPASALFETATVRQLAKRISELNSAPYCPLRNVHPTGKQAPLFYFHGDPGGGSYVNKLAKALGPNQPIFVIDPHGTRNEPIPDTIEEMAASRLPLIRNAQQEGPYRLCGYCMGGLVALESARLLVQAGQKVDLVLIDAPVVNARRSVRILLSALNRRAFQGDFLEQASVRIWRYLNRLEQSFNDPAQIAKIVRGRILASGNRMFVRLQRAVSKAPDPDAETVRAAAGRHAYFERYQIAMSRYVPKSLPVKVTFFSAEYSGAALRQLGCDVDVIRLSGDHYQILKDPDELAAYLQTSLRKEDRLGVVGAPA
jgi:oxalate---CoA ligase